MRVFGGKAKKKLKKIIYRIQRGNEDAYMFL